MWHVNYKNTRTFCTIYCYGSNQVKIYSQHVNCLCMYLVYPLIYQYDDFWMIEISNVFNQSTKAYMYVLCWKFYITFAHRSAGYVMVIHAYIKMFGIFRDIVIVLWSNFTYYCQFYYFRINAILYLNYLLCLIYKKYMHLGSLFHMATFLLVQYEFVILSYTLRFTLNKLLQLIIPIV